VTSMIWYFYPPTVEMSEREQAIAQLEKEGIPFFYQVYHERITAGDLRRVRLFWQAGMAVDEPDGNGYTILHLAAQRGHFDILRAAIERGADVNAKRTDTGETPIFGAINRSAGNEAYEEIVRELIAKGVRLNEQTRPNTVTGRGACTAIHVAASFGETGIVRMFIDAGADINRVNSSGISPLMIAIHRQHPEVAALLIASGADTSIRDQFGANAMDYALAQKDVATAKALGGLSSQVFPTKTISGGGMDGSGCADATWRVVENAKPIRRDTTR
jgi:ankyrin repeat protein